MPAADRSARAPGGNEPVPVPTEVEVARHRAVGHRHKLRGLPVRAAGCWPARSAAVGFDLSEQRERCWMLRRAAAPLGEGLPAGLRDRMDCPVGAGRLPTRNSRTRHYHGVVCVRHRMAIAWGPVPAGMLMFRGCTVRSGVRQRMTEQHLGAPCGVTDEHAVDEPPHEHETESALSGWTWGRRRLPPTPPIADLHAESVGLGPKGQLDDTRLIGVVRVLNGVGRRLTHRQQDFLSAVLRHRERREAAHTS
jgi:hypothetical protein